MERKSWRTSEDSSLFTIRTKQRMFNLGTIRCRLRAWIQCLTTILFISHSFLTQRNWVVIKLMRAFSQLWTAVSAQRTRLSNQWVWLQRARLWQGMFSQRSIGAPLTIRLMKSSTPPKKSNQGVHSGPSIDRLTVPAEDDTWLSSRTHTESMATNQETFYLSRRLSKRIKTMTYRWARQRLLRTSQATTALFLKLKWTKKLLSSQRVLLLVTRS